MQALLLLADCSTPQSTWKEAWPFQGDNQPIEGAVASSNRVYILVRGVADAKTNPPVTVVHIDVVALVLLNFPQAVLSEGVTLPFVGREHTWRNRFGLR